MPIDPRMFLGIGGPVAPQPMLPPGFRPPGPAPSAPPPMQQGQGGMGMGSGMGALGAGMAGLKGMFGGAGASPFAGIDVSNMTPDQQIGAFSSYGPQRGGFASWLRGLF